MADIVTKSIQKTKNNLSKKTFEKKQKQYFQVRRAGVPLHGTQTMIGKSNIHMPEYSKTLSKQQCNINQDSSINYIAENSNLD